MPDVAPLALPIGKAAERIGLSKGQFYREFLNTGRVRAVATGKRDRIVIVSELDDAFARYVAEQRGAAA
jgi:hypothetical protein